MSTTVVNVLKGSDLMKRVIARLESSFNARVYDGSHKLLSDILEIERARNADRFNGNNALANFTVVEQDRQLALRHNKTERVYILTNTAISNLFAKLSYKKELVTLLPQNVQEYLVMRYNRHHRNTIRSVSELKETLYSVSKRMSTVDVVQTLNHCIATNLEVSKETHQMKFQKVNDVSFIRCILDLKYKNFDITDIIESIQEFLDKNVSEWRVVRYSSDIFGDNFNLRISRHIQDKKDIKVKGEPLDYSLTISTSNTGKSSCNVSVGVTVLKCLNGMTGLGENDSFDLIHNRNNKDFFKESLNTLLQSAEGTWKHIEERYNLAEKIVIPEAERLIKSVCEDYSLGQEVSAKILREYQRDLKSDNLPTLKKVVDCITYIGHESYNISQGGFKNLEKLGSELLVNHEMFLEKYSVN